MGRASVKRTYPSSDSGLTHLFNGRGRSVVYSLHQRGQSNRISVLGNAQVLVSAYWVSRQLNESLRTALFQKAKNCRHEPTLYSIDLNLTA